MRRRSLVLLACFAFVAACKAPSGGGPRPDSPWIRLAELFGKEKAPTNFFHVGEGYYFSPEYCKYYILFPPIPAGKRGHLDIEDNQNPTGSIEVFVAPESWTPSDAAPRPPENPRTTMNGNGHTSAVGPGLLVIHMNTTPQPPARVKLEIAD